MANVIRIKRRLSTSNSGTAPPTGLRNAELAFNEVNNTLYIGRGGDGTGATADATSTPILGEGAVWTGTATFGNIKTTGYLATGEEAYAYTNSVLPTSGNAIGGKLLSTIQYVDEAVSRGTGSGMALHPVAADCATTAPITTGSYTEKLIGFPSVKIAFAPTTEAEGLALYVLQGTPTLQGVTLVAGDRVLILSHLDNQALRGIWKIPSGATSTTPWVREDNEMVAQYYTFGKRVYVTSGTAYGDKTLAVNSNPLAVTNNVAGMGWDTLSWSVVGTGNLVPSGGNALFTRVVRVRGSFYQIIRGKVVVDGVTLNQNDRFIFEPKNGEPGGIDPNYYPTYSALSGFLGPDTSSPDNARAGIYRVNYDKVTGGDVYNIVTRAGDLNDYLEFQTANNTNIYVTEGATYKNTYCTMSAATPFTLDTTVATFGAEQIPTFTTGTLSGTPVIDGVQTVAEVRNGSNIVTTRGSIILVKNEVDASTNGLYSIPVGGGTWVRHSSADENGELVYGSYIRVKDGAVNKNSGFVLVTNLDPLEIGTDPLYFQSPQTTLDFRAGIGLARSDRTLYVKSADQGRIRVTEAGVDLAFIADVGGQSVETDPALIGTAYLAVHADKYGRVLASSKDSLTADELRDKIIGVGATDDTTGTQHLVFSDSPAFTGVPTAITASPGNNSTQIATTAYVDAAAAAATVTAGNGLTQDVTGTIDVASTGNGSLTVTANSVNLTSGIATAGTYRSVTVDTYGRVTAGTTPTTLSGYGITDALSNSNTSVQSGYFGDIYLYDDSAPSHYLQVTNSANLTAARSFSINVNDANRTFSLSGNLTVSADATVSGTNTGDQTITLSGDVTGSGTGSFTVTLANSGVTAGTYRSVTVNAKGLVTGGSNPTTLSGYGITDAQPLDADLTAISGLAGTSGFLKKTAADTWSLDTAAYLTANQNISLSGDATGSGTTSITVTLANSGVTAGTYRSVTVNAKGLVTGGSNPTTFSGYGISDSSANLAAALTDETGFTTGAKAVFSTSPSFETSVVGPAGSFDVFNTASTTINAFGAATTISMGASASGTTTINSPNFTVSSAAAGTVNIGTNTSTFLTKTINIGTGGGGSSTTNINIGTAVAGTTTVNNDLVVSGQLTVNGLTTVLNTQTLSVDDKNIELGSVVSSGPFAASIFSFTTTSAGVTLTAAGATTTGMVVGQAVTGAGIGANAVISSIGGVTSFNITTTTASTNGNTSVSIGGATNDTADGGGITVKGAGDKTLNWVKATSAWTSSEHIALAGGKTVILNGSTSGAVTLSVPAVAGTTAIAFPATAGTVITTGDAGTVSATMLATDAVTTAKIADDAVSFAKLPNSAANGLSVVGRSANTAGDFAEINAATDGHVLRRSGTALGFGTIATAGITDAAVTSAKLRNSAALSVIGRSANDVGVPADIAAATDGHVLRRSGAAIGFGTIATAGLADSAVTNAKVLDGTLTASKFAADELCTAVGSCTIDGGTF